MPPTQCGYGLTRSSDPPQSRTALPGSPRRSLARLPGGLDRAIGRAGNREPEESATVALRSHDPFKMKMVVVGRVVFGAQHRVETLAGALLNDPEKFPLTIG